MHLTEQNEKSHLDYWTATLYNSNDQLKKIYQSDSKLDRFFDEDKFLKRKGISSKIDGMSIGDVRSSFQQLRVLGSQLRCDSLLWNGITAGSFAIKYLVKTYDMKKKKEAQKKICAEKKEFFLVLN
jgi:hypothetical protein